MFVPVGPLQEQRNRKQQKTKNIPVLWPADTVLSHEFISLLGMCGAAPQPERFALNNSGRDHFPAMFLTEGKP